MDFTDMDMLQDYEKDTRMAAFGYAMIQTEIFDPDLRRILGMVAKEALATQVKAAEMILKRGDRP